MANPHRGGVELKAGDATFTLSFSVNALCELEEAADRSIEEIGNELNRPGGARLTTVRLLVWAGLSDHHDDIDVKAAGDIIGKASLADTMAAVGKAFKLAFPDAEEKAGGNPPKAAKA